VSVCVCVCVCGLRKNRRKQAETDVFVGAEWGGDPATCAE